MQPRPREGLRKALPAAGHGQPAFEMPQGLEDAVIRLMSSSKVSAGTRTLLGELSSRLTWEKGPLTANRALAHRHAAQRLGTRSALAATV